MLDGGLGRDESLREAQTYTRDLALADIREKWLSKDMIEMLSGGNTDG